MPAVTHCFYCFTPLPLRAFQRIGLQDCEKSGKVLFWETGTLKIPAKGYKWPSLRLVAILLKDSRQAGITIIKKEILEALN